MFCRTNALSPHHTWASQTASTTVAEIRENLPELVLHFFWAGWSDETVFSDSESALRFWHAESEKRTLWHSVTEWRTTEIVFARKFENVWSLIKSGLIKIIHFLMRLRPKQSIEICLVNTYTCFIGTYRCRENYPWIINDLRWNSTNRFYAEKPMGGFNCLTDTCVISSAICMDKIACQSFVITGWWNTWCKFCTAFLRSHVSSFQLLHPVLWQPQGQYHKTILTQNSYWTSKITIKLVRLFWVKFHVEIFGTSLFSEWDSYFSDGTPVFGKGGVPDGNGSFRSYSSSDPGSFRSNSLSVRSFRPDLRFGSFRPTFGGSFRPTFGGSFRPTLFYIVLR